MDWGSESVFLPWKGRLISLTFPAGDPTGPSPRLFAPTTTPDEFRFVRKDDLPGQLISFKRDGTGKVIQVLMNYNAAEKIR
jgi:hypothetical protein